MYLRLGDHADRLPETIYRNKKTTIVPRQKRNIVEFCHLKGKSGIKESVYLCLCAETSSASVGCLFGLCDNVTNSNSTKKNLPGLNIKKPTKPDYIMIATIISLYILFI